MIWAAVALAGLVLALWIVVMILAKWTALHIEHHQRYDKDYR